MSKEYDVERAARALVDAAFHGDQVAAERANVTDRSIRRWRDRFDVDIRLQTLVREKLAVAEKDWAASLGSAITSAIEFLGDATKVADKSDPEVIRAVAGGLKILTDVATAKQLLDARLSATNRVHRTGDQQMVASGADRPGDADTH